VSMRALPTLPSLARITFMARCSFLLAVIWTGMAGSSAIWAVTPGTTKGTEGAAALNFTNDILPVLSKHGCNNGSCHGKAIGQNGFKLSLYGFDPAQDYAAIVDEGHGRRVSPAAPDDSLLLLKATGKLAHGGGVRFGV